MEKEVIKIEDIKTGLASTPPYADFMLEWVTDIGLFLYNLYIIFENTIFMLQMCEGIILCIVFLIFN